MLSLVLPILARLVASGSTSIIPLRLCLTALKSPNPLLAPPPPVRRLPADACCAASLSLSRSLSTSRSLIRSSSVKLAVLLPRPRPPRSSASSSLFDSRSAFSRLSSLSFWCSSASWTSSY